MLGSFINVCLTVLFLWPLFNSRPVLNPTVRTVAVRTLACVVVGHHHPDMSTDYGSSAAAVALSTSFVRCPPFPHDDPLAYLDDAG
jgi:hypothetical protein